MANRDFYGNWKSAPGVSATPGMSTFLNSIKGVGSSLASAINPFLGMAVNFGLNTLGNVVANNAVNAHLTGKEREQNAWNAEQAQINRDYQTEMSNTAWQRGVADMQAAGLNPALAYGQGGASTPTGTNAQGSASVVSPMDVMTMAMQMKMMQAEIGLKKSQERLNDAKADEAGANTGLISQNTENARVAYDQTVETINGLKIDNWRKQLLNTFAEQREKAEIKSIELGNEETRKRMEEIDAKVAKMSAEQQAIFQSIVESYSRIRLNNSSANLNDQSAIKVSYECSEVEEKTNKLIKEQEKIGADIRLTEQDIKWYCWNHASEVSGFGIKPGTRYHPASNDEIKNK